MASSTTPITEAKSNAIEVLSVAKTYSGGVKALLPVDLKVERGEFVTLLGPSGCGKSTLLKMIAGITQPTEGKVVLGRRESWPSTIKSHQPLDDQEQNNSSEPKLSFVFQSPTLMPWANVHKNVRLPLDLAGIPKDIADLQVGQVLETVGLTDFANALPRTLSGGMQMRVSIARGLVTKPDLLLMDEPFGALDAQTRLSMQELLLSVWQKLKPTIIFVTHDIDEALFLADSIYVMSARPGKIDRKISVPLDRPRKLEDTSSKIFRSLRLEILHMIRSTHG